MAKRKRHTAEQIASILRQQQAGLKVSEIRRTSRAMGVQLQGVAPIPWQTRRCSGRD